LWDVKTKKKLKTLKSSGAIYSLVFSPDGAILASGHGETLANGQPDGTIRLWNWKSNRSPIELKDHTNQVRSLAFSPDSSTLASTSEDRSIKLWDVKAVKAGRREPEQTLTDHQKSVQSVRFSPDGKTLVSGGQDKTVRVWQ
jgi:dipeptidyl aminopeptidase/acylaminoacyl peptidase